MRCLCFLYVQSGHLLVINGVITSINGLKNMGFTGVISPYLYSRSYFSRVITGLVRAHLGPESSGFLFSANYINYLCDMKDINSCHPCHKWGNCLNLAFGLFPQVCWKKPTIHHKPGDGFNHLKRHLVKLDHFSKFWTINNSQTLLWTKTITW